MNTPRAWARVLVLPLLLLGVVVMAPSPAFADCENGFVCDDAGDVVINPTDPGDPGNPTDPGNPAVGVDDDSGTSTGSQACTFQGKDVPCSSPDGAWNSGYGCYLQLAAGGGPPPPAAGNPNGAWYGCTQPGACAGTACTGTVMWLDNPPEALPSPAELAQTALERMDLKAIEIGIVPEDEPGRIGLVGMPVWLWVQDPAANTYGPITESATAGSLTVTATARVDSIVWSMGDGKSVTCTTGGTPYQDKYRDSDSPDCGHRYTTTSWDEPGHRFTVTATTQWVVAWTGGGQSGTIPIDHTAETQIRVGELQVLTQ